MSNQLEIPSIDALYLHSRHSYHASVALSGLLPTHIPSDRLSLTTSILQSVLHQRLLY